MENKLEDVKEKDETFDPIVQIFDGKSNNLKIVEKSVKTNSREIRMQKYIEKQKIKKEKLILGIKVALSTAAVIVLSTSAVNAFAETQKNNDYNDALDNSDFEPVITYTDYGNVLNETYDSSATKHKIQDGLTGDFTSEYNYSLIADNFYDQIICDNSLNEETILVELYKAVDNIVASQLDDLRDNDQFFNINHRKNNFPIVYNELVSNLYSKYSNNAKVTSIPANCELLSEKFDSLKKMDDEMKSVAIYYDKIGEENNSSGRSTR